MKFDTLIADARTHLNGRSRGREARLARLADGGCPCDEAGMRAWLEARLDAELEAASGVYHACTVCISSGVDKSLPTCRHWGCRITRVPLRARRCDGGDEEAYWIVLIGQIGVGYRSYTYDFESATAEEAVSRARHALLARDDSFATRREARLAVEHMLAARAR